MESNKTPINPQEIHSKDFQPQEMDTRFMENMESINKARIQDYKYRSEIEVEFEVKYFDINDSSADP